jgi:hypothetical protein
MPARLRRCALATALLCALTAPAAVSRPAQTCHDYVRFHERWELCANPGGVLETHRLGVVPSHQAG